MKPEDTEPGDRHRYFHDGWMLYKGETPVNVIVRNNYFYMRFQNNTDSPRVAMADLTPYYPEGQSLNVYDTGIYVGRRARQTARRTASLTHYEVMYSPRDRRVMVDRAVMWALCAPPNYPSVDDAQDRLMLPDIYSVAISSDIILEKAKAPRIQNVLWQGIPVGQMIDGIYVPANEGACVTKLCRMSLQELNYPCP